MPTSPAWQGSRSAVLQQAPGAPAPWFRAHATAGVTAHWGGVKRMFLLIAIHEGFVAQVGPIALLAPMHEPE